MMSNGHSVMAEWGLKHIEPAYNSAVLDIGCGGGANIKKMLSLCTYGRVSGINYSSVSVEKSRKVNRKAIANGRCDVTYGGVLALPFPEDSFDIVSAFEAVYFGHEIEGCFGEVYRVLKPNGCFMICNESNGETNKDDKWVEKIGGMTIYNSESLVHFLQMQALRIFKLIKMRKDGSA